MQFKTTTDFFHQINRVFHLILAGPLLFFGFLFIQKAQGEWPAIIHHPDYINWIIYLLMPLVMGAGIFAIRVYYQWKPENSTANLKDQLKVFLQEFIKFQTILGISSAIALIGLYLTGKPIFLGGYIFLLFASSIFRPTEEHISKKLKLSKENRTILFKKLPFQNENLSQNGNI